MSLYTSIKKVRLATKASSRASIAALSVLYAASCAPSISQLPAKPDRGTIPGEASETSVNSTAATRSKTDTSGRTNTAVTLASENQQATKKDSASILVKDSATTSTTIALSSPLPIKVSPYDSAWSAVRVTIDSIVNQPGFRTASVGILIIHENGDTIYAKDAHKLLVAASNMKVVTAAVALTELGANYKFKPNYLRLGLTDPMPSDYGSTYDVRLLRNGTLGDILAPMLKNSHNRLAEQIFRTIGLEKAKAPIRDSAAAAVTRSLLALGIARDGFVVHDGSGYDRKNYLSAETLVKLLTIFGKDSIFVNSMTVGGVDGTLMRRFRNTPAMGNIFAKTGSLNGIRSLSGYVYNIAGERVTFAILCNAYSLSPTGINATLDSMIVKLASVDIPPVFAQDASPSKQSTRSNTPKIQNVAH